MSAEDQTNLAEVAPSAPAEIKASGDEPVKNHKRKSFLDSVKRFVKRLSKKQKSTTEAKTEETAPEPAPASEEPAPAPEPVPEA